MAAQALLVACQGVAGSVLAGSAWGAVEALTGAVSVRRVLAAGWGR